MKTPCVLLTLSLLFAPILGHSAQFESGDQLKVTGNYSDNLFAAGREVDVDIQSSDDLFLAGRNVSFQGSTQQHLIVAGRDVVIDNAKIRELITAGGQVNVIRAEVSDDVVAAGGEIVFGPLSNVGGSVSLAGGTITLNGTISGNVDVRANRLVIGPGAVILGNLTHRTSSITIAPEARISGQTTAIPSTSPASTLVTLAGVLFLLGTFLVAPVLALLFRTTVSGGAEKIYQKFWPSLGKGFLVTLIVPIVLTALFMSAIGTPLALALLPAVALGSILAWTTVVYTIGTRMRALAMRQTSTSPSRLGVFGWTLLASFLVMLVLAIPAINVLFVPLSFFTGVGALYSHLRRQRVQRLADSDIREAAAA